MEQVSLERFDLESLGSFLTFDLNGFGGAGFGRDRKACFADPEDWLEQS